MEIVLGIVALVGFVILLGKMKGDPTPNDLTDEEIMRRMQIANNWIARFNALDQPDAGLKRQHDEKQRYIMELMLEMNTRHGDKQKESLAPAMQRVYELVRQGVPEDKAREQAIAEYVADRDARQAKAKEAQP